MNREEQDQKMKRVLRKFRDDHSEKLSEYRERQAFVPGPLARRMRSERAKFLKRHPHRRYRIRSLDGAVWTEKRVIPPRPRKQKVTR